MESHSSEDEAGEADREPLNEQGKEETQDRYDWPTLSQVSRPGPLEGAILEQHGTPRAFPVY